MSELIAPLERLGAEVERMAYAAEGGRDHARPRRRLPVRRPSLVIALALLLLLAAAAAIAATSGWLTGAPVKDPPGVGFRTDSDAGAIVPHSVHLSALRVADPDGGPPWSVRTLRTTRKMGCVQVGRVVDGKLGVLGRDGAFNDDNKFHDLPVGVRSRYECRPLDAAGRTFIAITYSGMTASALGYGCLARPLRFANDTPAGRQPLCPRRDLRNVYYGTLGPLGAAVSYKNPETGRTVTTPASGPDGTYLVVVRPSREHPARGGWFTLQTPASGFTAVHYRDGSTCTIKPANGPGGARPCEAKGYVSPPAPKLTARRVRSPIAVTVSRKTHAIEGRRTGSVTVPDQAVRAATVTFRSHVATPDARTYYLVTIKPAATRGAVARCGFGAMIGPVARTVRVGEIVHYDFSLNVACRERLTATVTLHRVGKAGDAAPYAGGRDAKDDLFVGRTTFISP